MAATCKYHTQPMTRLGIITNVHAGRNRSRLDQIRELTAALDADCREVHDLASIREASRELAAGRFDVLAVNGGDGTIHAVITELMRAGESLPDLALLPGGTTNMTANDVNQTTSLEDALASIADQAARPADRRAHVTRSLLRVSVPGIESQYCLFIGAGEIIDGMKHFRNHVGSHGLRGELAAGISLLRGLARMARGDSSGEVTVRVSGENGWREAQGLLIATTLDRLLLGLRPWWGAQDEPIRLTTLDRRPRAPFRTAPDLMRGKESARLTVANGYRSDNVSGFALRTGSGFSLDGELHYLREGETAEVIATPPVRFLSL